MSVLQKPDKGPVIHDWRPEDPAFWGSSGKQTATRNLWISIPALLLAFAVWMVWSTVIVRLNAIGFTFTTDQLFWLAALPGLSGATLRVFYSFMVPIFGGRRWTALSTASLLLPSIWMGFAVQDPSTSYSVFVLIALLCGFGGGNFASSMSNISFFYPKSQQGTALGLNAGLGNLGVSVMQFCVPLVITFGVFGFMGGSPQALPDGGQLWLQNAGFIWVPFIVLVTVLAWFGMNDLSSARASFSEQAVIFKRKHNWLMCWLIKTSFPDVIALKFAFLGPLVGALVRPLGGWLADKLGGAKVTLWNFVAMIVMVFGVMHFLPQNGEPGNFYGYLGMFMLLFITTGIGNGSTFRMIPVIFRTQHEKASAGKPPAVREQALKNAGKESAAVLGFSSAMGAFGAFFIPKSFGSSMALTGGPEMAFYMFVVFYLSCIVVTWWWYARKGAATPC
jgi:NNP family nitrate/nitrite transporter-like MFS transporter